MAHPDPPSPKEVARGGVLTPTVVGYAANSKNDNYEFVGDFGFHDAQRTEVWFAKILKHNYLSVNWDHFLHFCFFVSLPWNK